MKKAILLYMCCLAFSVIKAQSVDLLEEEVSSEWIKVFMPVKPIPASTTNTRPSNQPKPVTVQKPSSVKKPALTERTQSSTPKNTTAPDVFNKTNNKVNRFKKGKRN
jgi:uncharacterized secreted protein with C-terminal beta-propeller domain